ncbi:hypothetical protein PAPYR_4181 [Paratrimastix pyriformis]|uniref:Uncharacterized protein n=1 Tax=Paratrimastix pyriformis TaxID=342808 RepID=A0ABQ8UR10_9EUKA|nr:hypothetical protein PAPYR_4181 [Paratrimastix pyriformis]
MTRLELSAAKEALQQRAKEQMELTQARAKADAEAQGTASGAQARVADLETRLAQALAAKEGSAQRADQLAADLQKASRESAEAQTRVQTLSVELAAARRTAEAAPTPAEVAKWEAERATMNQELVTLRGRLELAEADRKEARRSLEELSQSMADRLGRAEGNANALATHVHEVAVPPLEGDLGRLRQEQQSGGTDRIATLERENAALRTENEKLRSMLTPQQKSKACIIL